MLLAHKGNTLVPDVKQSIVNVNVGVVPFKEIPSKQARIFSVSHNLDIMLEDFRSNANKNCNGSDCIQWLPSN